VAEPTQQRANALLALSAARARLEHAALDLAQQIEARVAAGHDAPERRERRFLAAARALRIALGQARAGR
jgi:hypothetical protein